MPLLAEFDACCEHLPFVDIAKALPKATVVLDPRFNHDELPLFVLSVTDGDQQVVEDVFDEIGEAGEYTVLGEAGSTRRYQIVPEESLEENLAPYIDDLSGLKALASAESIIERIEIMPTGWRHNGWFASREAFDAFREFWQRNGGFRLHRLTHEGGTEPPGDGLTDRQREALRTAYERGYFDIPRRVPLEEVAGELDISSSSVSERLRRAQTQLIEETVATTWPSLPE